MLCRARQSRLVLIVVSTALIALVAMGGISRRLLVAADTAAQHSSGPKLPDREGHSRARSLVPNPSAFNRKTTQRRTSVRDVPQIAVALGARPGECPPIPMPRAGRLVIDSPLISLQACAVRLQV